jgi:hypothetical protein
VLFVNQKGNSGVEEPQQLQLWEEEAEATNI